MRSCKSADRTGHMILQTLYQNCIKNNVRFFDEFFVADVLVYEGVARGVVAVEIATGELHVFHAKAVLLASGGFGRMFAVTSNAHSLTGEPVAALYRRGLPLEDMEFFQFHPTGIYKMGILLSEAARGEGGVLLNGRGERFLERYAPTLKDLAPRDMLSRFIYQEVTAGRGVDGKDYVYLDIRPETINRYGSAPGGRTVTAAELEEKLPDIIEMMRVYMGVEPMREPVPIQPTAHYAMGGIPTDNDGRVLSGPAQHGDRAVCGRRVRLRFGARRQPPGHEFAGGPGGLWAARRQGARRILPARGLRPIAGTARSARRRARSTNCAPAAAANGQASCAARCSV